MEENLDLNGQQDNTSSEEFTIPEEYANRGWTKTFEGKTGNELKNELFKCLDNSQTLVSKRVSEYLSNTDLSSLENFEEIKKALAPQLAPEIVVPETVEEYALNDVLKNENGEIEYSYSDDVLNTFAGEFKNLKLTKEQAQGVLKFYTNFEVEHFGKLTNADELEKSVQELFVNSPNSRKSCENLMKEFLSEEQQKYIQESVPNDTVMLLYALAKGVVDKYDYKEGNAQNSTASTNLVKTKEEKDAEYNAVVKELEELDKRQHTEAERKRVLDKLYSIY